MPKKLISMRIDESLQNEVKGHDKFKNFTDFVELALKYVLETSDFEEFVDEEREEE